MYKFSVNLINHSEEDKSGDSTNFNTTLRYLYVTFEYLPCQKVVGRRRNIAECTGA